MAEYIDVDALWRDVTSNIEDCGDVLEIIERQPVITINDHIAEGSKKVSSQSEPNCSEIPNNSDTISRESAIALADTLKDDVPDDERIANAVMAHNEGILEYQTALSMLPPAQPEERTDKHTESHACDLIDREAAIDAVNNLTYPSSLVDVKRILVDLPSAQPEIIRCKDCIYQTESWCGIKYCEAHGDHIGKDYDYCSNARRKDDE